MFKSHGWESVLGFPLGKCCLLLFCGMVRNVLWCTLRKKAVFPCVSFSPTVIVVNIQFNAVLFWVWATVRGSPALKSCGVCLLEVVQEGSVEVGRNWADISDRGGNATWFSLVVYAFQFVAVLSHGEKCFKVSYLLSLIWNSSTWSPHCNALALIHRSLSWEDTVPLVISCSHPASFGSVLVGISERCNILGWYDNVLLFFFLPWILFPLNSIGFYFINYLRRKCQLSSEKAWWNTQVLKICLTCPFFLMYYLVTLMNVLNQTDQNSRVTSWAGDREGLALHSAVPFTRGRVSKSHWEQTKLDQWMEWLLTCFFFTRSVFYLFTLLGD